MVLEIIYLIYMYKKDLAPNQTKPIDRTGGTESTLLRVALHGFWLVSLVWFGLVWFYGISIILGYLMPNQFYAYKQQYSLA